MPGISADPWNLRLESLKHSESQIRQHSEALDPLGRCKMLASLCVDTPPRALGRPYSSEQSLVKSPEMNQASTPFCRRVSPWLPEIFPEHRGPPGWPFQEHETFIALGSALEGEVCGPGASGIGSVVDAWLARNWASAVLPTWGYCASPTPSCL